ncbi:MAG TPA: aldo/keto reductase [Phycisphaerae bacterium]|nr:twin-arginine translocation signal domain-containing protein [Phycisphaerae bacterium]HOB75240.1 aldo/keto reductase [Phycisphaerae bacterium]HOJ54721.1 aldo/keto reductase [Phycisphaerae bacterium]HOL25928.1 aldo/keto reductase [Phycisphaerae bacterium]HPP19499.1 aldo/keto reductase [Phycisphaerae bacterium]
MPHDPRKLDRRDFLKATATLTGAAAVGSAPTAAAEPTPGAGAINEKDLIVRNRVPTMAYQRLGRTNYLCSRIVQGFGGDENLWRRLLARGVNYWDTGWGYGEGNHEKSLKPFLADHRDKLWITSKATNIAGFTRIDDEVRRLYLKAIKDFLPAEAYDRLENGDDKQGRADLLRFHEAAIAHQKATGKKPDLRPAGKRMAELYLQRLDESLQRMGIEHVDAYFVHGIEIPWIFDCIEVWEAYEKAHKAGKVRHFGFSTHQHQKPVLAAAAEANARGPWKIDLIMPGVNPITFDDWREELDALHKQDVGIIAMKTTGMKGKPLEGARRDRLRQKAGEIADYNEWEQKKLYMLHLTDGVIHACIAAMKDNREMQRDLALPAVQLSAEARRELKAYVKAGMAGACHLCGNCAVHCPEHIALVDMIRYHAYLHQYNERELAAELYAQAGYDPAKLCSHCGKCTDACDSGVKITEILYQLSADLA